MDCATESDIGTGAEMLAGSGCTAGRGRFLGRGFFSTGATSGADSSGGGADFVMRAEVMFVPASTARLGSTCFSSVAVTPGSSSVGGICSGTGAVFCSGAVAVIWEVDSTFVFFDFLI